MGVWTATAKLFSDALASILDGEKLGAVFPPKDPPALPGEDGRTHALRALRAYLQEITFQIPNPPGPPKPYRFPKDRIRLETDETPKNLLFPSISVEEGEPELKPIGLTPSVDESSANVFAPNTALVRSYEYTERITLNVWADTRSQRRAFAAGIEAMLSPAEDVGGIRLRMPKYYGETVRFTPIASGRMDGEMAGDRRRRMTLVLMMEFNVVRLVNVATMKPSAIVVPTDPNAPGS